MEFYIAQGIGLVVTGMSLVVQHFKKMRWIVLTEALMNLLAAAQYLLLKEMSGTWVSLIATANALCMLALVRDSDKRLLPNILCVVFALTQVAVGVWNIHMWYDVFPILGAVVFSVAMLQSRPFVYRMLRILNCLVWIVYCVNAGAYTMILTQLLCMFSAITAIIRLDRKKGA